MPLGLGLLSGTRTGSASRLRSVGWPVLGMAVLLLVGCDDAVPPTEKAVRPVKLVTAGDLSAMTLSYPGKVEASQKVELAFRVAGRVSELPVKEGDRVEQGALIAQLDTRDFQTRVDAAASELAQAEARLKEMEAGARPEDKLKLDSKVSEKKALYEQAAAELERARTLLRSDAVARSEYDLWNARYQATKEAFYQAQKEREIGLAGARQEEIEAQQALIKALKSQLKAAWDAFDDTTLRAPYTGVIAQRYIEIDQEVRAKEPVVKFQDTDEVVIVIDVPEAEAANLRESDLVSNEVEFAAIKGKRFPIDRVKETATEADPQTQTYRVRLAMRPPENFRILPGMTATVYAVLDPRRVLEAGMTLPPSAVQTSNDGKHFVWVVDPDQMTVSRRELEVTFPSSDVIRVVGGIQAGDQVVTAGGSSLQEGMRVRNFEQVSTTASQEGKLQ